MNLLMVYVQTLCGARGLIFVFHHIYEYQWKGLMSQDVLNAVSGFSTPKSMRRPDYLHFKKKDNCDVNGHVKSSRISAQKSGYLSSCNPKK